MNCPVCHQGDIADLDLKCKVCGSSMAPFRLLSDIKAQRELELANHTNAQSKMVSLERQLIKQNKVNGRIRLAFLLFILGTCIYWCTRPVNRVTSVSPSEMIRREKEHLEAQLELSILRMKKDIDTFHIMANGEILDDLALRYYGDKRMSIVMRKDSKYPNTHRMAIGDTVWLRRSFFTNKLPK